jgi:PBP1b-binding outer membrane lipoprotein LpoB
MRNRTILKKSTLLLMLCFASAIALSACKSTEEHPKKSEHPTQEHPTTNAPPQNPK